mmetsp:Transcript_68492/g.182711  ORF Transcript_68492/g.182711 Transcript_68492/m.182711 type:complete len:155 (+) Transcript_68492:560-1024(+)
MYQQREPSAMGSMDEPCPRHPSANLRSRFSLSFEGDCERELVGVASASTPNGERDRELVLELARGDGKGLSRGLMHGKLCVSQRALCLRTEFANSPTTSPSAGPSSPFSAVSAADVLQSLSASSIYLWQGSTRGHELARLKRGGMKTFGDFLSA